MQENINALLERAKMYYHAHGTFHHHPIKIHHQIKKKQKERKKTQALASLSLVSPLLF